MSDYALELQVKRRLGQITGRFCEFAVYESGNPKYLVFRPMQEISKGTFDEGGLEFPVRRANLKRGWKRWLH